MTDVLAVNAGSSSLKVALFSIEAGGGPAGEVDRWRSQVSFEPGAQPDLAEVADALAAAGLPAPAAIGHRVVHGGPDHVAPARVDAALRRDLEDLIPFAPLHQPAALAGMAAAARSWPDRPQVACFDTAFHHTLAPEAYTLAVPADERADGVRRYGFHGLSYEYVVDHLGPAAAGRMVMAHLGAGASLCATVDGRSVDTTMGFTPTGGVVMATRTGDLDPGVAVHLLRRLAADRPTDLAAGADELEDLVNHRSGLLGLSGRSGDVRQLLEARAAGDVAADLALAVFARSVAKQVGALAVAAGGLDTLVFTGGIGQHSPELRAEICAPASLGVLGVAIDPATNRIPDQTSGGIISAGRGPTVRVVDTDEERMIARHTAALLSSAGR